MTIQRRAKPTWPPELQAVSIVHDSDINLLVHTYATAQKEGVYWIDAVQVWLGEGQRIICAIDACVSYYGTEYKTGCIT
jgi:hypothetical protein